MSSTPRASSRPTTWTTTATESRIYHSHPRSPAEPSQTDINLAHYPHWIYLIVSLAAEPDVRAWRINDGHVSEEPIVVE